MGSIVSFEDVHLEVEPDAGLGWLLSTADVADGFGCTPDAVRQAKSRRGDELLEGRHWVVTDRHTPGGLQQVVMWSQRGVVRLGFMITSDRARRFRDFAEELVVSPRASAPDPVSASPLALSRALLEALEVQESRITGLAASTAHLEHQQAETVARLEQVTAKVDRRDPDDPMLAPITVTTIGSLLVPPISGMRVNQLLKDLGLQWWQNDQWTPTADGRPFAVQIPVRHASGRIHEHLQWQRRVVDVVERRLARRRALTLQS
jgi:hypothetical protein